MRAPPRGAGLTTAGTDAVSVSPLSPRHSLDPLPATRAAGRSGPACWRCGDPEHFIDRCPMMEVGTMIRVPDAPQVAPGQASGYQIPVSINPFTREFKIFYLSPQREFFQATVILDCLALLFPWRRVMLVM